MSLIELLVAVAVVAILASIAYPSYRDHVRRAHRAAAASWLMDVAARQQQRFVDVRSYAGTYADLGMTTPPDVDTHYTITVAPVASPLGFTATATPKGDQATDKCGTLVIDQAGAKTANGAIRADCW